MIVCVNCRKEMCCDKTGLGVRFGLDHVYPGDSFHCDGCGATVIKTTDAPTHDPDHKINTLQIPEAKNT